VAHAVGMNPESPVAQLTASVPQITDLGQNCIRVGALIYKNRKANGLGEV
jgi:hypothetical protein